jgi:4-hydroxy-3-methylbut-2-enyl diphosphate reductase
LVTKVHHEARRFAGEDYDILLIGHEGHEEVEGTAGEAPDNIILVQSPDDVASIEVRDPDKVAWLSQTTLSVDETLETVDRIRQRFPNLLDPPSDDICYATQNRQQAVKEIAQQNDLVLVVGSGNSSNSVRLVEVALESGAAAAYRVDDASEIDEAWLQGVDSVGVTSGASVPEDLVQGVLEFLADRGYPAATAVRTAEESLIFALPPEMRRDLRAAGLS